MESKLIAELMEKGQRFGVASLSIKGGDIEIHFRRDNSFKNDLERKDGEEPKKRKLITDDQLLLNPYEGLELEHG